MTGRGDGAESSPSDGVREGIDSNPDTGTLRPRPIWDRGDPIDEELMRFTVGDDWLWDRRLVEVDIEGSLAHVAGLERAGHVSSEDASAIRTGLSALLEEFRAGAWTVEPTDEDVHSAIERRLIDKIGSAGKRLHTGRSRNDQVAVDIRLWLRCACDESRASARALHAAIVEFGRRHGGLPIPGYTHLRRAMPSSVEAWAAAHAFALAESLDGFATVDARVRLCPLGSGAGYGVPLALDREGVARELGFDGPEEPVTATQNLRGRAELAYVTVLESLSLDLSKLATDLWLFTTTEFSFAQLPVELTTGSSMMPQKRNPDAIELLRARCRETISDRAVLLGVLRDLPSGYHRDFQLIKPPLFRAHDRMLGCLSIATKLVSGLVWNEHELQRAAADPDLQATRRTLECVRTGVPFRDAYVEESRDS